jgi:hypothetical protein
LPVRRRREATRKNHLRLTVVGTVRFNERDQQKRGGGFASDRALNIKIAHDLGAKPLRLWRIMRQKRGATRWLMMRT